MYLKLALYIMNVPLCIYALDSINLNNIFKVNKIFQARLLYFIICFSLAYLFTNFLYDFAVNCRIY